MPKKRYNAEEIIDKRREAQALLQRLQTLVSLLCVAAE